MNNFLIRGVITIYSIVATFMAIYFIIPLVGMIFGYGFMDTAKSVGCIIFGGIISLIGTAAIILINEDNKKK